MSAAAAEPPPMDSKAAFLATEGTKKRKRPSGDAEEGMFLTISPRPFTSFKEGNVVEFNYKTGNQPIRFVDEPIQIAYTVKKKVGNDLNAVKNEDRLFFDPTVGMAASVIQGVDIYMRGQLIYSERRGIFGMYNSANTKCCKREYWEKEHPDRLKARIANSDEDSLKFIKCDVTPLIICCSGLDGVPLLGRPKCFLSHFREGGKIWQNKSVIVPPKTELTIKLQLVENFTVKLYKKGIVFANYFLNEKPVKGAAEDQATFATREAAFEATFIPKSVTVTISDINLLAERMSLKNYKMEEGQVFSFYHDAPQFQHSQIQSNSSTVQLVHDIPKSVPVAFFATLFDTQFNADTKVIPSN